MKAGFVGLVCSLMLCLSNLGFACTGSCNHLNSTAGKTVGWVGGTTGKIVNGVGNGYSTIMYHTFHTTHHLLDNGCNDNCK